MALIKCPECKQEVSDQAVACPHCAFPIAAQLADKLHPETALLIVHPSMFGNHPLYFLLCVALIPAGIATAFMFAQPLLVVLSGVGLAILVGWWLVCESTELTVTTKRTILRRGLLSKSTNEIRNKDVRDIHVAQSLFHRLMGTGSLGISSAAEEGGDIEIAGIPYPQQAAELIRKNQ